MYPFWLRGNRCMLKCAIETWWGSFLCVACKLLWVRLYYVYILNIYLYFICFLFYFILFIHRIYLSCCFVLYFYLLVCSYVYLFCFILIIYLFWGGKVVSREDLMKFRTVFYSSWLTSLLETNSVATCCKVQYVSV